MFEVRFGGTLWRVGVPFFAFVAACLAIDRSGTAALCVLASFLHEGGHIAAFCLLGTPPREVTAGVCGIRLIPDNTPLSYCRQALMLLAGPTVNLACAALLWVFSQNPVAVASHLLLGLFNLLPIESLDGGQCLKCVLAHYLSPEAAEKTVRVVSAVTLLPISAVGFYLLIRRQNATLFLVCVYLVIRLFGDEHI